MTHWGLKGVSEHNRNRVRMIDVDESCAEVLNNKLHVDGKIIR